MDTGVTLLKIVEVALKIREAVDTARQNKGDCVHVKSRVETLQKTVLLYKEIVEVAKNEAVQSALEGAKTVLDEALRVVTDCQEEERNIICILCAAGKHSKELSKVDGRITGVTSDIMGAVQADIASRLANAPPATDHPSTQRYPGSVTHGDAAFTNMPLSCVDAALTSSLPQQIIEVAREIKEATKTVRWNKAGFMKIEKHASGVSALMSPLKNYTKLVNHETTRGALEKLLDAFYQARTLVMSYQGIRIDVFLWPKGKVAKQARKVLDQMLTDISAVNLIVMHGLTPH